MKTIFIIAVLILAIILYLNNKVQTKVESKTSNFSNSSSTFKESPNSNNGISSKAEPYE